MPKMQERSVAGRRQWSAGDIGAVAFIVALTAFMYGRPVPFGDEAAYLVESYHWYHPEFLQGDWTFSEPWYEHTIFHSLIGLLMIPLGLETVGWAGRIIVWTVTAAAIIRIAKALGVPLPLTILAVGIWIGAEQFIVAGSLVLSVFSPSNLAYALAFTAVANLCNGSRGRALLWSGLAFSVHPATGLPFLLSVGLSTLAVHGTDWKTLFRLALIGIIAGGPGLITAWLLMSNAQPTGHEIWEEFVKYNMPYGLYLSAFPKRDLAWLALTVLTCGLILRNAPSRSPASDAIAWTLLGALIVLLFGVAATILGAWQWLETTPFRVLPVVAPLFFLLLFFSILPYLAQVFLVTLLASLTTLTCFGNPIGGLWDGTWHTVDAWRTYKTDPLRNALRWVAQNTPRDAVLLAPPNFKEAFWLGRRPIVALMGIPRFDRLYDYRERTKLIAGAELRKDYSSGNEWRANVDQHFSSISLDAIRTLRSQYGASLLISEGEYGLPVLHTAGNYRVYDLASMPPITEKQPQ